MWTITERATEISQSQAYNQWTAAINEGQLATLVTTYKAGVHMWDFSSADLCIFAQQPWVPGWKTNSLGRFFHSKTPKGTKVNVLSLDVHLGINRLLNELWTKGMKLRGGFIGTYIREKLEDPEADGSLEKNDELEELETQK